jgi:hypothetical protein
VTKYLRKQLKERKDLFWLTVSKDPIHSYLAPLLLGHSKSETSRQTGTAEESCSPHRDRKEGERAGGQEIPFEVTPLVTYFFPLGPTS